MGLIDLLHSRLRETLSSQEVLQEIIQEVDAFLEVVRLLDFEEGTGKEEQSIDLDPR